MTSNDLDFRIFLFKFRFSIYILFVSKYYLSIVNYENISGYQ